MNRIQKIIYTLKHWIAYQKVARKLRAWRPRHLLHDLDKVLMLSVGISPKKVSKIHRSWSSHHPKGNTIKNPIDAVIDWEAARFTKPDKPLNARETWRKYYRHVRGIKDALDKLGL